jgi:hypothetical protein
MENIFLFFVSIILFSIFASLEAITIYYKIKNKKNGNLQSRII